MTNSTRHFRHGESQDPGWGCSGCCGPTRTWQPKNANKAYQHLFEVLLANEKMASVLSFGWEDRTGFGAILILTALGVPMKTIEKDYLFTNEVIKDFVSQLLAKEKAAGADDSLLATFRDLQTVQPDYFKYLLNVINRDYGSINAYLHQQIGLSNADLLDLRTIYLEK